VATTWAPQASDDEKATRRIVERMVERMAAPGRDPKSPLERGLRFIIPEHPSDIDSLRLSYHLRALINQPYGV
jgi:hypothetical protein